jgi:hypothetical protein
VEQVPWSIPTSQSKPLSPAPQASDLIDAVELATAVDFEEFKHFLDHVQNCVGGSLVGSQPRATLKIKTHKTIALSCAHVRRLGKNAEAL